MIVAGAGMAGLCAAARARQLGLQPVVLEKGDRPGGSMLLSSGVIWRYRTLDDFRSECPGGDTALQRLIVERLDDALDWLESVGAKPLAKETANPRTHGWRFDTHDLTATLVRAAGGVRVRDPFDTATETRPVVLATGGFPGRLARLLGLPLRANPWSEGDGYDYGRGSGAASTAAMDEFYGRAMPAAPARWGESEFVDHAQLYGRHARVLDESGGEIFVDSEDWSETRLVQEIARRGGTAWYLVAPDDLRRETPYGTVAEVIERARLAGGTVKERGGSFAVHVAAAVTHTIGGLAIDDGARVIGECGDPVDGLYAAGVDAGGWSSGGYASGLAAALVFGLTAAETAAT